MFFIVSFIFNRAGFVPDVLFSHPERYFFKKNANYMGKPEGSISFLSEEFSWIILITRSRIVYFLIIGDVPYFLMVYFLILLSKVCRVIPRILAESLLFLFVYRNTLTIWSSSI